MISLPRPNQVVTEIQHLSSEEIRMLCKATEGLPVFIVGGQATNFWSILYSDRHPELAAFSPFTSKDIDFYGGPEAAEELSIRIDGKLSLPELDHHGPGSAIVRVKIGDREMVIDFINTVLGVSPNAIKRGGQVTALIDDQSGGSIEIGVMHPLYCLQSRIANVSTLGRRDEITIRQLNAAPYALLGYLEDMIEQDRKELHRTVKELHKFLRSPLLGKPAHLISELSYDPIDILKNLQADDRLDRRYRNMTIKNMIAQIQDRRSSFSPDR